MSVKQNLMRYFLYASASFTLLSALGCNKQKNHDFKEGDNGFYTTSYDGPNETGGVSQLEFSKNDGQFEGQWNPTGESLLVHYKDGGNKLDSLPQQPEILRAIYKKVSSSGNTMEVVEYHGRTFSNRRDNYGHQEMRGDTAETVKDAYYKNFKDEKEAWDKGPGLVLGPFSELK